MNDGQLVQHEIRKLKVTYYLVSEDTLRSIRSSSIIGDILSAVAAIVFSASFSVTGKPQVALWVAGAILVLVAAGFYIGKYRTTRTILMTQPAESHGAAYLAGTSDVHGKAEVQPGLIVESAVYGTDSKHSVDVTQQVRDRLRSGQQVVATHQELGVEDPHEDVVKTLEVTYVVDGQRLTKRFREHDVVDLP